MKIISDKLNEMKYKRILPWVMLGFIYIAYLLFMYRYIDTHIDSDMASEMIYAALLNKEGKFISNNWFFSTRIRLVYCHLFFRIGLWIFPNNWRIARLVGSAFHIVCYVMSFILCSNKIKNTYKNTSIYFTMLAICPVGAWYMEHILFGNHYLISCVLILIWLIMIISLLQSKSIYLSLVFIIVNMLNGMDCITYAIYTVMPLFLVCCVEYVYFKLSDIDMKSFWRLAKIWLISIISFGIGYAINIMYFSKIYTFASYEDTYIKSFSFNNIINTFFNYLTMFGYPYDDFSAGLTGYDTVNSKYILLVALGLLFAFIVVASTIYNIFIFKELNRTERIVFELSVLSVFVMACCMSLTSIADNCSYYAALLPLTFLSLQISVNHIKWKLFSKKQLVIFACISVAMISVLTCMRYIEKPLRAKPELRQITDVLEVLDAKTIYALFWDGNTIAEMSNGQIEAYIVDDYEGLKITEWLQEKRHLKRLESGEVYMILEKECVPQRDVNNLPWYDSSKMPFVYGDGNTDYWVIKADFADINLGVDS